MSTAALSTFLPSTAASRFGPMPGEQCNLPAVLHLGVIPSITQMPTPGDEDVWPYVCPKEDLCWLCWVHCERREGLGKERNESQSFTGCWDYNRSSLERTSIALAMGVALWILAEASSKAVVSGDSD